MILFQFFLVTNMKKLWSHAEFWTTFENEKDSHEFCCKFWCYTVYWTSVKHTTEIDG